ncbi:hypothetical protein [Amycolatopsis suaedae]|uniref:Uncharacterized protein n=1 Tax=Amycolatopsis suaedae TaxID=2510978 RepID=A0A4Q7J484_9PSEU|nr:hypothetical protein [Amycolatopsis suaedae]RZQ61618.1 hypothetical protein EWH70_21855 [Amycolatopsis suaedae]
MNPANDDALFSGDGTQAPAPPRTFGDPLAGLVTTAPAAPGEDILGPPRAKPVQPVEPDSDVVREMVRAAMGEAGEAPAEAGEQAEEPAAATPAQAPPPVPPVEVPRQRTWPVKAPQLRKVRRKFREEGSAGVVRPKPSSGMAGMIVALVLIAVFVIVAIQLVSSLINGLSDMFN